MKKNKSSEDNSIFFKKIENDIIFGMSNIHEVNSEDLRKILEYNNNGFSVIVPSIRSQFKIFLNSTHTPLQVLEAYKKYLKDNNK